VGEDESSVHVFENEYPIDFPILLDPLSESLQSWRIKGLPTTYIISPKGIVAYSALGPREWDDSRILDKIRALKQAEPAIKEMQQPPETAIVLETKKEAKEEVKSPSFIEAIFNFFK
jgi:hypothetical protein